MTLTIPEFLLVAGVAIVLGRPVLSLVRDFLTKPADLGRAYKQHFPENKLSTSGVSESRLVHGQAEKNQAPRGVHVPRAPGLDVDA